MLPILGDSNRQTAWPARIAKLQSHIHQTSDSDLRIAEMFVESEKALTKTAPVSKNLKCALDLMNQRARSDSTQLTDEFLFELQRALGVEEGLRVLEMAGQVPGHNPAKPAIVAKLLETTLDWFGAESFRELHPIEQSVLVHSRFLDMQFFPTENTRLSRFAADFFLIRAALPPIIISGEKDKYKAALHQALLMNTQPLIDLIVETTERTLLELLQETEK
jgi:hypothetical protein